MRNMSEYQITYWREIPSMVVAREGDETARAQLAQRFQEAIDEAAMRVGVKVSGRQRRARRPKSPTV